MVPTHDHPFITEYQARPDQGVYNNGLEQFGEPIQAAIPLEEESGIVSNAERTRRRRTKFSNEQLAYLNQHFEVNRYPSEAQRAVYSRDTGLNNKCLVTWFNNRRAKERKKENELLQNS